MVKPPSPTSRMSALGARAVLVVSMIAGVLGAPACGGSSSSSGSSSPFDLPTVVNSGGPLLTAPRVQPIYFPGFAFQPDIDTFLSKLPGSTYWPRVVAEYGVGALTILSSHVSSINAGAALLDTGMANLLAQVLSADATALGAPSRDTIYLMLFPPTTTITTQGQVMCSDNGPSGYHTELSIGGVGVSAVVLPSCSTYAGDSTLTGVQALTPTISHEIVESATDPFVMSAPAYFDVDERHAIWSVAINGGEVADLCENETPDLVTPDDIGYPVQRVWSNAAAAAGTGPCVPVPPGEIFFIAVPSLTTQVAVDRNGAKFSVPALSAAVGAAATVSVNLRSESGGVPPWVVGALEYHSDSASLPQPPSLSGSAGQTLRLSVTPNEVASGLFPLIIASATQTAVHFWIGAVDRK